MAIFNENQEQVGVIGLGIIGTRVADCLRNAGHNVYVWNRSPKPVPNFLSSPGEIAQLAEVIQIFVSNGEALLGVIDSLRDRITKKHVIINNSTVDPESTREAARLVEEVEGAFLDCPFTGSKLAAEKGALVYYVGGEPKVLDRVRGLLEISAKEILFFGKIGDASVLKIVTNMISATTVQALSEAYALTVASGIEPEKLAEAIENNACGSALTAMKLPSIIARDFEPHFSLKNMFKDAQFGLNLGNDLSIDLPALSATASVMFKTMQKGHGDADYSVLAKNYQDAAGAEPPPASKKAAAKKKKAGDPG